MSTPRSQYRFLLALARALLHERPGITTSELAHQLSVSESTVRSYRAKIAAGVDPVDPVAEARLFLIQQPQATVQQVADHLGLSYEAARVHRKKALALLARNPPAPVPKKPLPKPQHTYPIPRFLDLKEL
jgi:DNA-binding CsgD family transcriptional regulator